MLKIFTAFLMITTLQAQEIDPARLAPLPARPRALLESAISDFPQRKPSHAQAPREMVTFESIRAPLEDVWNAYVQMAPSQIWQGPIVNFVVAIDRETQAVHYFDDHDVPYFKIGMMILNYLNFFGHYILVGHEVTAIDHLNKRIELAYLEGNTSSGKQILEFKQKGKRTIIKHISIYKSSSRFRDRFLYPIFHRLTANEYHHNMRGFIE